MLEIYNIFLSSNESTNTSKDTYYIHSENVDLFHIYKSEFSVLNDHVNNIIVNKSFLLIDDVKDQIEEWFENTQGVWYV